MKKTYLQPAMHTQRIAPASIIAASLHISDDTIVTDPDDVAVKDEGNWGDIWD